MNKYEEFLAGERHGDVTIFLHADANAELEDLAAAGIETDDGAFIVIDGEQGRSVFQTATGRDPVGLASEARENESHVEADLTGGECPSDEDESSDHFSKYIFAFSEAQNEAVDGIYAEGDVMHAYVVCNCGTTYADKWLLDERA